MGTKTVTRLSSATDRQSFTRAIFADLQALEALLESNDLMERGVRRMGMEQELFLVDEDGAAAPIAPELFETFTDPRFTTELARFNIEANLPPQPLDGSFLRDLETELADIVATARLQTRGHNAEVVMTGILPSLRRVDLVPENLTPEERYALLDEALRGLRGGQPLVISIRGVDELELRSESVILEAANTSIQLHLQVDPEDFGRLYNLSQLLSAPLLAAASNSPMFLGRRLWRETRVALFENAVETRNASEQVRGQTSRVAFGDAWVEGGVLDLLRDDALRCRPVLVREAEEDPVAMVKAGKVPALRALTLHNGTVWRWNRPCYGVADGKAHLRIENRVLPSGPSVLDEVANAALYYGMMVELDEAYGPVSERLRFDEAKANFQAAARQGLDAQVTWLDARRVAVRSLLLDELIPAARRGLRTIGVSDEDRDRYLGVLEQRIRTRKTGATWLLEGLETLRAREPGEGALRALTRTLVERQKTGLPVHRWEPAESEAEAKAPAKSIYRTVGDIMTRSLFTVRPDDVVDLATQGMDWKHVRHVPVETDDGLIAGLVSARALIRLAVRGGADQTTVAEIMDEEFSVVSPDLPILDGIEVLGDAKASCVLVADEGRLVGIATERDFLRATAALLRERS